MPAATLRHGLDPAQQFDIYVPTSQCATERPWPVLVFFHGGAWIRGGLDWLRFMAPAVTSMPAVFVAGTYRLAPHNRWPAQHEDVCVTLRQVASRIAEFGGDPQRIAVGGHSAGGHLAAMAVLTGDLMPVVGCLPISSPCDLRYGDVALDSEEGRVYKYLLLERSHDAHASPILRIQANTTPFHVTWGQHDFPRIAKSSAAFACALQQQGSPASFHEIPGLGHFETHLALSDPQNAWYAVLRKLVAHRVDDGAQRPSPWPLATGHPM